MREDPPENLPPGDSPQPRRLILTHAPDDAFAPSSRTILAKLGYWIVAAEEFEAVAADLGVDRPDLRIVDERELPEVPETGGASVPILVVTGRHGVTGADPRIAGAIRRPAGLHELYRLMQQVLEDTPRAAPRVPTHLSGRVRRNDKEWAVAVLSLSENGCLIRSPQPILLGSRIELSFELPGAGPLQFDAETAYQLVPDLGMIFHATPPAIREAVSSFVSEALLTR